MQENYTLVQDGFRLLLPAMARFIGNEMKDRYRSNWWEEVQYTLNYPPELPSNGTYNELIESLDVANCIRLIKFKWKDVFQYSVRNKSSRVWADELMGVRNIVSHIGARDLDQPTAERALDTMALLCEEIDHATAVQIRELYKEVRSRAADTYRPPETIVYEGAAQPETSSVRGALTEGSLLKLIGTDAVERTTLTRKVTFAGKTEVYPVYKVRLDLLYYNDQNDRIATWISGYESENGKDSLSGLNRDIYNRVIEDFVVESNPDSIKKTQNNIMMVGQREPGVTLADGRVVDGNRRFTCLRRIQRESAEPVFFETVIMDVDMMADKKQIKLLEIAVQHGEEKKVDYDLIDYAIGTYRDVITTNLLTAEEYAESANESVADVRRRIEIADMITDYLSYIGLPEQYHAAREYQVYSLFQEMIAPLRKLGSDGQEQLKVVSYNNAMMRAIPDQRKFIRDIKALIKNNAYQQYFEDQDGINGTIQDRLQDVEVRTKKDLDIFAEKNKDIAESLQYSMERALQRLRAKKLKNLPLESVSKSIDMLRDIDTRLLEKMGTDEKTQLNDELADLITTAEKIKELL